MLGMGRLVRVEVCPMRRRAHVVESGAGGRCDDCKALRRGALRPCGVRCEPAGTSRRETPRRVTRPRLVFYDVLRTRERII